MAVAAAPAARPRETVRVKRERDQELLVWPDLVFVEFISAVLFTVTFVVLSTVLNSPLLNKANTAITPNPSKAPWYFMNLQELLLHMDKSLAGVIVPTALIVGLMAIPYLDRNSEGQGSWFATVNSVRITAFSFVWSSVWIIWLILWDNGSHVLVYKNLPELWGSDKQLQWLGDKNPFGGWPGEAAFKAMWDFVFLKNRLAIDNEWKWSVPVPFQPGTGEHDGSLNWPQDFDNVPVPLNGTWAFHWGRPAWMPSWLERIYWYDREFDVAKITAEWIVPIIAMVALPLLMILILKKIGWSHSMRDNVIAIFTGFILVYTALTMIGVAFRGKDQNLVPTPRVPNLEDDPHIQRQLPAGAIYGLYDPRSGTHA